MLGSVLGAWETLGMHVTLAGPRYVSISAKRARGKRESASTPSALIDVLGQCLPVEKGSCRGKEEPRAGGGNLASAREMENY